MRGSPLEVAVIGGGITGLAAANRLLELAREQGAPLPSMRLLESTSRIGGAVLTERLGEYLLEGGPDTLVARKPGGIRLCEKLGLADRLFGVESRRSGTQVVRGGRLANLPRGFLMMAPMRLSPMLASPLFSPAGKVRMMCEFLVPPRKDPDGDESLSSFVTRRFGREVLERAAEPIIAGLFTADAERMSLKMTMPRFLDLERRFGSVTRGLRYAERLGKSERAGTPRNDYGDFAALEGGLGLLIDELGRRLSPDGIQLHSRVRSVDSDPASGRWRIRIAGSEDLEAESVIFTSPAFSIARTLGGMDAALGDDLERIRYASCATVNLVYRRRDIRRPLESFGFFVPRTERLPILACSFASVKFEGRVPKDKVLLRAFVGGAREPEVLDQEDERLSATVHRTLRSLLGIDGEPVLSRTYRFFQSMPQYQVGDFDLIGRIKERVFRHSGLFLAGSALGAVGLPDCIVSGEQAAAKATEFLDARARRFDLAI